MELKSMLPNVFRGFQLAHALLLGLAAVGFFVFWARTRFWLPKYAHVLAAIGLAVGLWCAANVADDAPIHRQGPVARVLLALIVPAMVYFFFVFYGGQRAAFRNKPKNADEIANTIERFLNNASLYPQEWNDFIERRHPDAHLDSYRRRCYELDPFVNNTEPQDAKAVANLRNMVHELRSLSTPG